MELIAAKVLLKNLLDRVETREDGSKQLTGKLPDQELAAYARRLEFLIARQPRRSLYRQGCPRPRHRCSPVPWFRIRVGK